MALPAEAARSENVIVDKRLANIDCNDLAPRPIAATIPATVADCHLRIQNADITPAYIIPATTPASALPRREVLSVKTNVLFDCLHAGYDRFCYSNVALEYYPLHGHFTYGASFDCPWWQHYDEHKYFQVRTINCTPLLSAQQRRQQTQTGRRRGFQRFIPQSIRACVPIQHLLR